MLEHKHRGDSVSAAYSTDALWKMLNSPVLPGHKGLAPFVTRNYWIVSAGVPAATAHLDVEVTESLLITTPRRIRWRVTAKRACIDITPVAFHEMR